MIFANVADYVVKNAFVPVSTIKQQNDGVALAAPLCWQFNSLDGTIIRPRAQGTRREGGKKLTSCGTPLLRAKVRTSLL